VSNAGLVTGVATGVAWIVATSEGMKDSAHVTVTAPPDIHGLWTLTDSVRDAAAGIICQSIQLNTLTQAGATFAGSNEQVGYCAIGVGVGGNFGSFPITSGAVTSSAISFVEPAISAGNPDCVYQGTLFHTPVDSADGTETCAGFGVNLTGHWSMKRGAPAAPSIAAFTAVVARHNVTCGLVAGGAAYCWGNGLSGGLGTGSPLPRIVPTAVKGGLALSSISPGTTSCGVTTGSAGYCWGAGGSGQLGNGGTNQSVYDPVAVTGGLNFQSISAGGATTCGVTTAGAGYCWGNGGDGRLGNGGLNDSPSPVAVSGGLTFGAISVGIAHACGITTTGAAYCWGFNGGGELGDGTNNSSSVPVPISGGLSFTSIAAGDEVTCGVTTTTGAAYCWGFNNTGAVGDGTTTMRLVPTAVVGGLLFTTVDVAMVNGHACGVTTSGAAYCWGDNTNGQLGDGSTSQSSVPVAVSGGLNFLTVSASDGHSCGLATGGVAYCWGANGAGQLGDGTVTERHAPTKVAGQP
jgi:hypothetical protein